MEETPIGQFGRGLCPGRRGQDRGHGERGALQADREDEGRAGLVEKKSWIWVLRRSGR